MNTKDAIKSALGSSQFVMKAFLADLSDADLLVRPVPGANHVAWQLGHLVVAEQSFLKNLPGAVVPELPAGFAEKHSQAYAAADSTEGFATKDEYIALMKKMREATLAALEQLPDTELDRAVTGRVARIAPTVGDLLLLAASHPVMHSGQISVLRRKLGKPVAF
jgi:uncharacterized damage-inducible protein DinB